MENFQLYFITEDSDFDFNLKTNSDESKLFLTEFLLCFNPMIDDRGKKSIDFLQEFSQETLNKLENVFNPSLLAMNQKFYGFLKCFKTIPIGNFFYMFKNKLPQQIHLEAKINLRILNQKKYNSEEELELLLKKEKDIFFPFIESIVSNYEVEVYSASIQKKYLGLADKNLRQCRFCGLTKASGATFKKEAHAISEGLGNSNLINNEECDKCNETFGNTIEREFIEFFNFFRIFYNVKGKERVSQDDFQNAKIKNTEGGIQIFYRSNETENENSEKVNTYLLKQHQNKKIKFENLYKAAVKYALSVMPLTDLNLYQDSINWLNGAEKIKNTPNVAICINSGRNEKYPRIGLYKRKDMNNIDLPYYFSELKFGAVAIVCIIPFSKIKETDLCAKENFERFWNILTHYKPASWEFWNLNSDKEVSYEFELIFEQEPNSL